MLLPWTLREQPPPRVRPRRAEIQGLVFNGFVAALRRSGALAEVRERVSLATRSAIDQPPPARAWIASDLSDDLVTVAASAVGLERSRAIAREATEANIVPPLRTLIGGFLRLFGATPPSIFARIQSLTDHVSHGVRYEFRRTGGRSGVMVVEYPLQHDVPFAVFQSIAGGLEVVFSLCGTTGVIADPVIREDRSRNAASMKISW